MRHRFEYLLALFLIVTVLGVKAQGVWTPLPFPPRLTRDAHALIPFGDGVMLLGGRTEAKGATTASCWLYSTTTGRVRPLRSMPHARAFCPILVLSGGDLLASGGFAQMKGDDRTIAASDLYDARRSRWRKLPPLHTPRELHTATLLPDGTALIAGGFSNNAILNTTEIYQPATRTWKDGPLMQAQRFGQTATALDGWVLIAGGRGPNDVSLAACERYDVAASTFASAPAMRQERFRHTATRLNDGRVLVVGGYGSAGKQTWNTAEIYDPATNEWTLLTATMQDGRMDHTATLLPDGRVLVVGGWSSQKSQTVASADLFNPADNTFTPAASLPVSCHEHAAVLLPDGTVFVVGGLHVEGGQAQTLPTGLRYTP